SLRCSPSSPSAPQFFRPPPNGASPLSPRIRISIPDLRVEIPPLGLRPAQPVEYFWRHIAIIISPPRGHEPYRQHPPPLIILGLFDHARRHEVSPQLSEKRQRKAKGFSSSPNPAKPAHLLPRGEKGEVHRRFPKRPPLPSRGGGRG